MMEYKEIAEIETCLFPETDKIDKEYILVSKAYKELFSRFFINKTGLDRLDARLMHKNYKAIKVSGDEEDDFYFAEDSLNLRFFCLRCIARVERLSKKDMEIMTSYLDKMDDADLKEKAKEVVLRTYKNVMVVNDKDPENIYSPRLTLMQEYNMSGASIPVLMRSIPSYSEDGELMDKDEETKRQQNLLSIKRQIEPILSKAIGCNVVIVLKMF